MAYSYLHILRMMNQLHGAPLPLCIYMMVRGGDDPQSNLNKTIVKGTTSSGSTSNKVSNKVSQYNGSLQTLSPGDILLLLLGASLLPNNSWRQ